MFKNKTQAIYPVLMIMFCLIGCVKKEKLPEIDFNDTIELKETKAGIKDKEINICVGSMITPKEGYAYYKALLDYIGRQLKMKVNFIERESYAEVDMLLEGGKIDVAFVCGGPYIDGHEKFGLELIAAPEVDGKPVYHSYIIVHKDSGINKFEELKGKVFVFADPLSNSGRIYPVLLLKQLNETPETFFREYFYSYAHDLSIKAVAEGIADAGAVDSLIWNHLDRTGSPETRETRIIKISPAYGIPPVVVRPDLRGDLKYKIKQILLNMHNTEEGKEILKKMFIERFIPVDDSNYDSIRKAKEFLRD